MTVLSVVEFVMYLFIWFISPLYFLFFVYISNPHPKYIPNYDLNFPLQIILSQNDAKIYCKNALKFTVEFLLKFNKKMLLKIDFKIH